MTHTELKQQLSELEIIIKTAKTEQEDLQRRFIEEHREFQDGDKVLVVTDGVSERGIIAGAKYRVNVFLPGSPPIRYDIRKINKAGNASNHSLQHMTMYSIITKID